ncbi:hypothetical protein CDIK_2581 [Cucumispora dikerogammari]|nr:hypothetical protein CDIK_2581 [Cucumispora dikerogammari]
MVKQLTRNQRIKIVELAEKGFSTKYIAAKHKINTLTVTKTVKKYKTTNEYVHYGGNERLSVLSSVVLTIISKENFNNEKKSLRKIAAIVEQDTKEPISHSSVPKTMHSLGKFVFASINKPLLGDKNVARRLECSRKWLFMNEDSLESIIFSVESKFNFFIQMGRFLSEKNPELGLILIIFHLLSSMKGVVS